MPLPKRSQTVPDIMLPVYTAIIAQTDAFCQAHLDAECAVLCRELAAALARKRPSPIVRGQPGIWAAGVISALASVNFWYDRSQTPHTTLAHICQFFDASSSAVGGKSKQIRTMFKMHPLDPGWTAPSKLDDNPIMWMVEVNGFVVDIRNMPRETQVIAYEKGIIPYIPADQTAPDDK